MSYTYLLEQEEESSAECFSDIPASALSSGTSTPARSCLPDNETDACHASQSGTMCKLSTASLGEGVSMSCAEDFPARTLAPLEKAQESTASALECGATWRESSVKFDLVSLSWKTHRCLWEEVLPWCSVILPKWGMMRGGELWERTTQALHTSENESGFWPTPRCQMTRPDRARHDLTNGHKCNLEEVVAVRTWPTPRNCSAMAASITQESAWADRFPNLETVVGRRTWPTPTAHNAKECDAPSEAHRNEPTLTHQARGGDKTLPNKLNPVWVEWLMGWPLGWSDLNALEMDKFQQWLHSHGKFSASNAAVATSLTP